MIQLEKSLQSEADDHLRIMNEHQIDAKDVRALIVKQRNRSIEYTDKQNETKEKSKESYNAAMLILRLSKEI